MKTVLIVLGVALLVAFVAYLVFKWFFSLLKY